MKAEIDWNLLWYYLIEKLIKQSAGLSEDWSTDPLIIIENSLGIIFLVSGLVKGTVLFTHQNKV